MSRGRILSWLLSVLLVPTLCWAGEPSIDPNNPPSGRFSDEWAEVHLAGGKVGYMHSTLSREGDLIHTTITTEMRLGRVDSPVTIRTTNATTETVSGVLVGFESEMDAAQIKTAMRGAVKDGRITIVTTQLGMSQERSFDFSKDWLMTWGMYREGLVRGSKTGLKYSLQIYEPDLRLDGPIPVVTEVGSIEKFDFHGTAKRGRRVAVTMDAPSGSITTVSWLDQQQRPLRAQIPMPGLGDIVIYLTDQKSALGDFVPPEIFMASTIKANKKIVREKAQRITYHLSSKDPSQELDDIPSVGMQRATILPGGSVELVVSRPVCAPLANPPAPLPPAELAEYLEPNLVMNTKDPELVALARKAAGDARDPFELANKLRRFVTSYIDTKNLNIGFATASEVCRTREGDCSEHAVLLAALGRINHLPARVAVGLAFVPSFGGRKDIFGYHMWTQFYLDGRWIDYDAALAETVCSPTRLAFAVSSLKNSGMADLSLPLLSKIGALDIDIVKIEEVPSPEE